MAESTREKITKTIEKYKLEQKLLNYRLNSLDKENRPDSKSREQEDRALKIIKIKDRLVQLDSLLEKGTNFLERLTPAVELSIKNKSSNLQVDDNLSVKKETDFVLDKEERETLELRLTKKTLCGRRYGK